MRGIISPVAVQSCFLDWQHLGVHINNFALRTTNYYLLPQIIELFNFYTFLLYTGRSFAMFSKKSTIQTVFILSVCHIAGIYSQVGPFDALQYRSLFRSFREFQFNFIGSNSNDEYSLNFNKKMGVSFNYQLLNLNWLDFMYLENAKGIRWKSAFLLWY